MAETANFKSFNYLENGDVSFSILDTIKTTKTLVPGSYKLSYHSGFQGGWFFDIEDYHKPPPTTVYKPVIDTSLNHIYAL